MCSVCLNLIWKLFHTIFSEVIFVRNFFPSQKVRQKKYWLTSSFSNYITHKLFPVTIRKCTKFHPKQMERVKFHFLLNCWCHCFWLLSIFSGFLIFCTFHIFWPGEGAHPRTNASSNQTEYITICCWLLVHVGYLTLRYCVHHSYCHTHTRTHTHWYTYSVHIYSRARSRAHRHWIK